MSRPRGVSYKDVLPRYGAEKELLFRRFEATIPFGRLVTVTFGAVHVRLALSGEVWTLTGLPHRNLVDVIYLRLSSGLRGIPKGLVHDIQGATMPSPDPSPPAPPGVLPEDDPRFTRFATAIMLEERVRVVHMERIPHDPAIADLRLNTYGIEVTVEGRASLIDETWLTLSRFIERPGQPPDPAMKLTIPRDMVVDIVFLGPRAVLAEEMV